MGGIYDRIRRLFDVLNYKAFIMLNGHNPTTALFSAILGGIIAAGGSLFAAGLWVGSITHDIEANKRELEERATLVSKIPVIASRVEDIRDNQRKILCRLGDISFCDTSGGPR